MNSVAENTNETTGNTELTSKTGEAANPAGKKSFNRYLITAALPYANGPIHIGHLAGVYLPADIYVRYLRAQKRDVKFVSGSDEHGVPITIRAMKEGVSPQEIVDKYHAIIKNSLEQMGVSFDIYSRTSNQIHHKTSQDFFLNLYEKNLFEEKESEQYYDEKAKTFFGRPLYYWYLPGMRQPECLRRPMRTLRLFAEPGNAHQPAQCFK